MGAAESWQLSDYACARISWPDSGISDHRAAADVARRDRHDAPRWTASMPGTGRAALSRAAVLQRAKAEKQCVDREWFRPPRQRHVRCATIAAWPAGSEIPQAGGTMAPARSQVSRKACGSAGPETGGLPAPAAGGGGHGCGGD